MGSQRRTWGVRLPSGEVKVYGDQEYVKDGSALKDHEDGLVVVAEVEIKVGRWRLPKGEDEFYPTFTGVKEATGG